MATAALIASDDGGAQARWLPAIATGDALATLAISEKIGEWDPDRLEASANGGRLNGEKPLVPFASVSDAILVAARDDDGPGIWLVERGAAGMEITALSGNDMTRRLDAVRFENTPAVKIASGRAALDRARDVGLVLLAADSYGGANRSLRMTSEYSLTREQFGQVIGAFQGVKHQLADMATELEPALSLWWYTAHALDHIRDKAERHAALTKAHLTDVYDMVSRYAIELHGGIGFTWEYDLHLWFRRALFNRSFLGNAAYHRKRAAALANW
jgi:alkylation response protein AidB-like acyl-CoA dehydrogenase